MKGKGKVPQTKEHLYGGQCALTEPIIQKWNKNIHETLVKDVRSEKEANFIKAVWEKETKEIRYEHRHKEQHKRSPALIGIWKNKTTLESRNWLMKTKGWNEEVAFKQTFKIIKMKLEQGREITKAMAK